MTWIGTGCAGVSREPQERRRRGRPSSMKWRKSSPMRFDSARRGRCFLWQVPRPETSLEGLQKPLVRQVSAWQVMRCSLGAFARHGLCKHRFTLLALWDWSTSCWCSPAHRSHPNLGCFSCEPSPMRARQSHRFGSCTRCELLSTHASAGMITALWKLKRLAWCDQACADHGALSWRRTRPQVQRRCTSSHGSQSGSNQRAAMRLTNN